MIIGSPVPMMQFVRPRNPAVLRAVARMGYEGVEFAGYYGRSAAELRKLLDDNGLKCCGTHTGLNTILGDELLVAVAERLTSLVRRVVRYTAG